MVGTIGRGMHELPPGWETDLAVLAHSGSLFEEFEDHLVVRSPDNPGFHWGNFVMVTDPDSVHDAGRWVETFQSAFPSATWQAFGLVRTPSDVSDWTAHGLEVELDEVLTARVQPTQTPLPDGYAVRRIAGTDWAQHASRSIEENARTGEHEPRAHEQFVRAQVRTRRSFSDRGVGAFFGAFADGALVADLGIVRCGTTARFQSVGTDEAHRRRGLASHLLGVAARWAGDQGCDQWVIVTEATNPAGRVYRRLGFEPDVGNAAAYRGRADV